ncbi:uncharacterized protein [Dermacentor albipictus]|uniref:uncharacterized protein isoform X2 n=1 Tax=Dermacentor albipictus TaxID=60249 RepID=UPI0038FC5179
MAELSVLPSTMVRSSIPSTLSRMNFSPQVQNTMPAQYCSLCVVGTLILAVSGYAFYLAFLKNRGNKLPWVANKEEPPLLCSLDGRYTFPYPVQMCSYIIFLSAMIDVDNGKVEPLAGTEAQYLAFKDANKTGELKKLLSFRYDDVSSRTADAINTGFVNVRSTVFHGIDIRVTHSDPTWLKLLTDLRLLADQNGYLIHVVFDVPVGVEISQVHMATLRVYKPLSQGPYKASPIQTLTQIEQAVDKYSKEVLLSGAGQLALSAWHCVGLSLAAVSFQSTRDLEDDAVGIKRLSYCDFNRNKSKKIPFDASYYTTSYQNDLVVFEQDKEFTEKVKAITKLSKSCVLLDHVYYDYHHCQCDQPNFKLLRATRRVLWGKSARQY